MKKELEKRIYSSLIILPITLFFIIQGFLRVFGELIMVLCLEFFGKSLPIFLVKYTRIDLFIIEQV